MDMQDSHLQVVKYLVQKNNVNRDEQKKKC